MSLVKSGSRRIPAGFENKIGLDGPFYGRVETKKPAVVRKGDCVKKCFFWNGAKQCLGVQCFWSRVGTCSVYSKIRGKRRFAK